MSDFIYITLGVVVFICIGLFLFFQPVLFWKITEQWKSYDATEPSELFIKSTKFGGIAFIGVAVFIAICYFML